jgi:hypothetical protein
MATKKNKKEVEAKKVTSPKAEKAKGNSFEEAQDKLLKLKDAASASRSALQSFTKKNNLSMKEAPADKKLKPEWEKLTKAYSEARTKRDAQEEAVKALKPKAERASKYEYPKECVTKEDKKKFRATQRAAANKAEKAASPKKSKKAKKEEVPAEPAKKASSKKSGKKNKKVKKASKED